MFDVFKNDFIAETRQPIEQTAINEKENNNNDSLVDKIMVFFKENKNPPDEKIHNLAEKLNIDPHKFEAAIYGILSSFLSNGRFNESGKKESDLPSDQIEMGIKVEAEHTTSKEMARRIALDHLAEFDNYYTALLNMENDLKKGK